MWEMLQSPFMQRALLAGGLVAFLAGYFGAFVVQRGLGFLGSGLAHAAFGGIGLGILLGLNPLAVAVPFTILVALGIVWLQENTRLSSDTSIGVFFSTSMALGLIFLFHTKRWSTDAFTYLFGSLMAVNATDLWVTAAVALASLATWPLWGRWATATFDRDLARAEKIAARRDDYLLALAPAVTIVVSMKVVGMTLVAAFLVIPPATARLLTRTFSAMTLLSVVLSVATVLGGLTLSWFLNWPPSAVVILLQATLFAGAFGVNVLRN